MTELEKDIEGEIVVDDPQASLATAGPSVLANRDLRPSNTRTKKLYLLLPVIFLAVTLLGGMRLGAVDNAFIFIKPALVCLVFAAILVALFVRSGVVALNGWFSDKFSALQNAANAAVLLTLFTASAQLFNSLLPEQGLPFWVVAFCFFWTLWNNLFSDFDTRRLIRSLAALFGLAFVVKYLVLANLTAPAGDGWLQRLIANPGKEAFTWLLDLPRYSAGTGYIQFFVVAMYVAGLYLTPRSMKE